MKILIIGYFGRNNLGDDLMLRNLVEKISKYNHSAKISVVFHDIDSMPNELTGINRISSSNKKDYLSEIIFSDAVIWGGGTCFYDAQDKNNNRGISDLVKISIMCKLFRTKLIFLGVGIGYISKEIEKKISIIFKLSHSLYFRDQGSLIESKKFKDNHTYRSGDLALLLDTFKYRSSECKYITYSGVFDYDVDVDKLVENLEYLASKFDAEIAFLPCHRTPRDDNEHHKIIAKKLNCKYKIFDVNDIDNYLKVLTHSYFHIGVRLHSIVLSDLLGIPNLGIEYSPKLKKYIYSTGILSDIRSNESISNVNARNMEKIISFYERPNEYIKIENEHSDFAIKKVLSEI